MARRPNPPRRSSSDVDAGESSTGSGGYGKDASEIEAQRDAVIREHGAWAGHNIYLAHGVWTMGAGGGVAARNAQRIAQVVTDAVGPAKEIRVLDLGAGEGIYSVELAAQGATVTAIEGRPESAEKIRFVKEVRGLSRLEVACEDIRELDYARYGMFDVILCLGVLYHLEAQDVVKVARAIASMSRRVAVFGGAISLIPKERHESDGTNYFGRRYPEEPHPWASLGNPESFWLTKPSLLRLLDGVGFTSVLEVANPPLPELDAHADHVTLVAVKGSPVDPLAAPAALVGSGEAGDSWPEAPTRRVHPIQEPLARLPLLRALYRRRLAKTFK